jgi:hypothetical protein
MTTFLDKTDFDLLSGWNRSEARDMLLHFKVTMVRLCDRLDRLRVFRNAHRVRKTKEDTFWHIGSPQTDAAGNLEAYQYFQPFERHLYIRNHGGAGEIQFNIGVFGDGWGTVSRSVRVAMGFSFGGRFIADKGSLGTVKTPWFFRSFRELMQQDPSLRAQLESAIAEHQMRFSRDHSPTDAGELVDAMLALDENTLPGDEITWVAFEHFVHWADDQADLMDMDSFVNRHCKPVFEACYPIWEAVQNHTRRHYGDVI